MVFRRIPFRAHLALVALALPLLGSGAAGQMFYGYDGGAATIWESTFLSGPPCGQPNTVRLPCISTGTCGLPAPGPIPPAAPLFGATCTDTQTNTIFYTDGFVIQEVAARGPCSTPGVCLPVNSFPNVYFPASISGMAMDETGAILGFPRTLFLTDGFAIVGVVPGPCGATVVFGPCPIATPVGGPLTGLTYDPVTKTLWACDILGLVHNIGIVPGGCGILSSFAPAGICIPAGTPLTGITYDLATPDLVTGGPPCLFITDGLRIEHIDAIGGAPAPPTFYAPTSCSPVNAPLNGLAFNLNGIGYGTPRVSASLTSWGQSSSPGPSFGLEISGSPAVPAWLIMNFNVPGPGFFCPPVTGLGTSFWVDPTGAFVLGLGVLPPGCVPIPLPLPPSVPTGVRGFVQIIYTPGGPAVDATNGLSMTVGAP